MFVGIDPGTRNLGVCVWADGRMDFRVLDLISLDPSSRKDPTKLVRGAFEKGFFPFAGALICVETQMAKTQCLVAQAFRLLFWEETRMVRPHAWKKYHGTSTGKYRKNKQASIQKVLDLCREGKLPEGTKEKLLALKKKDDAADAILMCLYARDSLSGKG